MKRIEICPVCKRPFPEWDLKTIGGRLRQARLSAGLSQRALQKKTDISFGFISQFENGKNDISVRYLIKLSKGLDVSTCYLLSGAK